MNAEQEIVKYQVLVRCGHCGDETMVIVPQRKCQNPKCGKPLAVVVRTTEPVDVPAKPKPPAPKPPVVQGKPPVPPIVDLDSAAGLGESEESSGGIFDKYLSRRKQERS